MNYTILGIFSDHVNAENAIKQLKDENFNSKNISILMNNTTEAKDFGQTTGTDVVAGATSGVATGAIVGGLAGLLGAFVIPGLGAFLLGGPIAASLGVGGTTAATLSGAATGAVAGGILGALMSFGLPREEAAVYEQRIREGGILIAVPATQGQVDTALRILEENSADQVRSVSTEPHNMVAKEEDDVALYTTAIPINEYAHAQMYAGAKGGESSEKTEDRGLARASKTTRKRVASLGGKSSGEKRNK